MARIESDPNYTSPTFSRATAATDPFKKEDVQLVAAALSTHDHTTGKGLPINAGSIPNGTITSAMIADGTIATADLADGSVTSAKIADGTIQSVDIAAAGIANDRLGPDVARANLLTNGGFEIWQRGNGPFTANNGYSADRWNMQLGGSSTYSVSRDTANTDVSSSACAAVTYSHNVLSFFIQTVGTSSEPGLANGLRGKTVTFSIRVKTSTANAVQVSFFGPVLGRQTSGVFHSGNGTYQTLSVTVTIPTNETATQVEVQFSASCTAYLDNAMLVVGSQLANYVPLHPADDLARCLRYYQRLESASGGFTFLALGQATSATAATFNIPLLARLAINPSITFTAANTFTATNAAGSATTGATGLALNASANPPSMVAVLVTGLTGLVAGNATWLLSNNTPAAVIMEANI